MGAGNNNNYNEAVSLSARSRPQYHYFYGSTEVADNIRGEIPEADHDDSLFGEELVATDHEDELPTTSERDLPYLIITNGESSKPPSRDRPFHIGLLPVSLSILAVVMLLVVAFPNESEPMPEYEFVPYTHVDRSEFGDPVASFLSMELFHPTLLSDTIPRTFKFPFPTGAFWTNLVVLARSDIRSYPIAVYPYAYKWADSHLQLSYPAARRVVEKLSIQDAFEPDITISTQEDVQNRYITKFDPLSVTLRFVSTPESKWETSLVQGSPYATIKVLNSTPVFTPLSTFKSIQCPGDDNEIFGDFVEKEDEGWRRRRLFGVCSIDESDEKKTTIRGVQFMFKTAEGLSWIMFSSEPMNLEFDAAKKTTIKSSALFTGIIRLAHIPEMNSNEKTADPYEKTADSSTGLRRLIYHAGVYPTGGQVSWEFHAPLSPATGATSSDKKSESSGRHATVTFNYVTQTMLDASHIPLLMLALPHHADLLSASIMLKSKMFDLVFQSIKGPLTPVVGSTWSYTEPLLDIGIDGPFQEIDPRIRRQLLEQIDDDLGQLLPTSADNIFGFGKQIARLAQLTHIAKKVHKDGDQNNGFETGIAEKGTALLSNYLEMFLSSQVTDKLVFDSNLGGLVSTNGLLDPGEDFGNGRYNGA
jgi:endoglucanase Acf2